MKLILVLNTHRVANLATLFQELATRFPTGFISFQNGLSEINPVLMVEGYDFSVEDRIWFQHLQRPHLGDPNTKDRLALLYGVDEIQ